MATNAQLLHTLIGKRGMNMRYGWQNHQACERHYHQPQPWIQVLAVVMIAVGLMLLMLCIPSWAWTVLVGAALVVVGCLLLGVCRR